MRDIKEGEGVEFFVCLCVVIILILRIRVGWV